MHIRISSALLLAAVAAAPLPAQTNLVGGRVIGTIDYFSDVGQNFSGDTYHFTAWTASGGNFSGGRVFGTYNDGGGCGSGGNIGFLELVRLDFNNKGNTRISCINGMSGYGGGSQKNYPDGWTDGNTWKSFDPISVNGVIYMNVVRQTQSNPWSASMSTIIMSPDNGAHWCNPATIARYGSCSSSHWSSGGDAPANAATGMMWGSVNDTANKMTRLTPIQYCQDESCTGMPDGGDQFMYFFSEDGNTHRYYLSCVAKPDLPALDVTKWYYYKGGSAPCQDSSSWSNSVEDLAVVGSGSVGRDQMGLIGGIAYLKDIGLYVASAHVRGDQLILSSAPHPWGPWKVRYVSPNGFGRQNAIMLSTYSAACAGCGDNPRRGAVGVDAQVTISAALPPHHPALSAYFRTISLQSENPLEISPVGQTKLQFSGGANPRALSRPGLLWAYDFGDNLAWGNSDPSAWQSTYNDEITGTNNCMVTMSGGGTNSLGSQNATANIRLSKDGVNLGGIYASHITSNKGDCAANSPLTGDPAFTLVMVVRPSSVTGNAQGIFEMGGPISAHTYLYAAINAIVHSGSHLDISDGGGRAVTGEPGWSAGKTYVLTITKAPGVISNSTVSVYLGSTKIPLAEQGSPDGAPDIGPGPVRLGCWSVRPGGCDPGDWFGAAWPSVWSYFALYNRVLSPEEIGRNYLALQAAMARPPRRLTIE